MPNVTSWFTNPRQTAAQWGGALGSTINKVGNFLGNPLPNLNISESLQSWGGNPSMPFKLVKPAYASESTQPNASYNPPASYQSWQPVSQPTGSQPSNNQFGLPYEALNNWQKQQVNQNQPQGQPDYTSQMRGAIESGYNNYFRELDAMLGELPNQLSAQQNIVGSQYQQGVGDITAQKEMGMTDLGAQRRKTEAGQVKTLNDLAEAMRNQFQTGQVMLGTRGAGDSSAANQYAYALTKMGNKQRGDVVAQNAEIMNQIGDREFKLGTIFTQETNRLSSERDTKLADIAQWYSEAQQQIRQMKLSGQFSKTQDLIQTAQTALNYAMQQLGQVQTEYSNRRTALEQWAMNNATTIQQLKQNMAQVSSYTANPPAFQPIQGTPQFGAGGNLTAYTPGGYSTDEEKQF